MVTPSSPATTEGSVLYRELALRILVQNLLLILSLALFAAFAILSLVLPETAWAAAAAHGVAGLGAALQWCHHGIRTKQIKEYLLLIHPDEAGGTTTGGGWERWLPANRPRTLMGSRWRISTKGVFLGLQLAMIGLALRAPAAPEVVLVLVTAVLLLASAGFLLTNPKE